jgi:hypothetical protein
MTNVPNDPIDPYESRLARRVGSFSDQAVVPIDPVSIAASAAVGARRRTLAGRLLGWTRPAARLAAIGAGALLIVALGALIGAGGLNPSQSPLPTQGAVGPVATPTAVPGSGSDACAVGDLDARITGWDGAAGHRIATVTVRNIGRTRCSIATLASPRLVDRDGVALIAGPRAGPASSLELAPNAVATTMVDTANYCGPAGAEPVTVAFAFVDGPPLTASPDPTPGSLGGVPPCNGPTVPPEIQMQPFTLAG